MILQRSTLGRLVNFLLGVAWALIIIGSFYAFIHYYSFGLIDAIMMTFLGALPGLFLVVLLEYLIIGVQRLEEAKRQTALLEQLLRQNKSILEMKDSDRS